MGPNRISKNRDLVFGAGNGQTIKLFFKILHLRIFGPEVILIGIFEPEIVNRRLVRDVLQFPSVGRILFVVRRSQSSQRCAIAYHYVIK